MTPKFEQEQLSYLADPELAQPAIVAPLSDNANARSGEFSIGAPKGDEFISHANDFVFLTDNAKCWLVRTSDIWTLEACGNYTRVHLSDATPLIRRPLRECERRLDPSTFFRARRDCIVNLGRVKQTRMRVPFKIVFVLQDGREIIGSHEQSVVFRRSREF